MPELLKPPYVEKVVDLEGIQVWVVDGMYVRGHLDMAAGWPYSKAHAHSSRLELRCRRHPDELHEALAGEGWT